MPLHTQCHRNALSPHCLGTRLLRKMRARSSGLRVPHKSVMMPMVEMAAQHYMEGDARATSASPTLTFSLIRAMLSAITRFCVSRKDFRAAAVLRRKVSPRCCSARSVARCVTCALLNSPAVPLATTSACREASVDARMLR